MFDEAGKYIEAHYPGLFVLIFTVVAVFVLSWKIFRLYGRLEKVEDHCSKIEGINTDSTTVKDQSSNRSSPAVRLLCPVEVFVDQFG